MAKKRGSKKSTPALEIRLVLTTDEYSGAWKKAQRTTGIDMASIDKAVSAAASKIALKFFAINNVIRLSEKAFKGLIRVAQDMEKKGQGNEGTAAVSRLTKTFGEFGTNLAKTILEMRGTKQIMDFLSGALDIANTALIGWKGSLMVVIATWDTAIGRLKQGIGVIMATTMPGTLAGAGIDLFKKGSADVEGAKVTAKAGGAMIHAANVAARAAKWAESVQKLARDLAKKAEADVARWVRAEAAFSSAGRGTVDAFVSSWEHGFERLGELFNEFPNRIGRALGGMSEKTVGALGDVFSAVGFMGPLVERVFGQGEKAAKKFQAAQLALVGGLAVVKAAMAIAEASDLLSENPGAAAAKLAAAAGYSVAAGLAGVAAHQTLAAGARGGTASQFTDPGRFETQARKSVTVVIENLIGSDEFVRDTLIPALNDAAGDGVLVMATTSQSANRVEPGR